MKKQLLSGALALTIGLSSLGTLGGISASAEEIPATDATTTTAAETQSAPADIQSRTFIGDPNIGEVNILDHGNFANVGIAPYIIGVPNTGKISAHYDSTQVGLGLFSASYFTLGLPEILSVIASQDDFASYVTATLKAPGVQNRQYTLDEISTSVDRITLKNPSMSYILKRDMSVDITINYGKFLDKYPGMIDYIKDMQSSNSLMDFSGVTTDYNWIDLTLFDSSMAHFKVDKQLIYTKN